MSVAAGAIEGVLACGWHHSYCPGWNPWQGVKGLGGGERELGLSKLPAGVEWVVQKYAESFSPEKV